MPVSLAPNQGWVGDRSKLEKRGDSHHVPSRIGTSHGVTSCGLGNIAMSSVGRVKRLRRHGVSSLPNSSRDSRRRWPLSSRTMTQDGL